MAAPATRILPYTLPSYALSALLGVLLSACGGSMNMKKSDQGLFGTFTTYGPPPVLGDCEPLVTQAEKDACKRENLRVIEEPFQSAITIRNVGTRETLETSLDAQGSFRVELLPGTYEVCLADECSDPLDVRMGKFTTYGQRLPRPAAELQEPQGTAPKSIEKAPLSF